MDKVEDVTGIKLYLCKFLMDKLEKYFKISET